MQLYCGDGPNSYRVRIFMAEKGIDVPRVWVDFEKGEHKSADFLKLNSLGQIPVLVLDNGTVITESVAICRYLEELHPQPALFGAGAVSRAKVEMWNRRVELEVFTTIGDVALHTQEFFKDRLPQFPEFGEARKLEAPRKWEWLDREIADGRPFIAGDVFSVADITGAVAAWLGEVFGIERPASLENVNRWLERVRAAEVGRRLTAGLRVASRFCMVMLDRKETMARRNSSLGLFGRFGRSSDLRQLDEALRDVDLHPAVVPEGVKLTIVNLMKDAWPNAEPPDQAYLPVAGLFAYCVIGREPFLAANGEERLADVETRIEAALDADDSLDARLVLLAIHARLVSGDVMERFGLSAAEQD